MFHVFYRFFFSERGTSSTSVLARYVIFWHFLVFSDAKRSKQRLFGVSESEIAEPVIDFRHPINRNLQQIRLMQLIAFAFCERYCGILVAPWWLFLPSILFNVYISIAYKEKLTKYSTMVREFRKASNSCLYDGVSNVRAVKSFGRGNNFNFSVNNVSFLNYSNLRRLEKDEVWRFTQRWNSFHEKEYEQDKFYHIRDGTSTVTTLQAKE